MQDQFNLVNSEIEKGNFEFAEAELKRIAAQNPDIKMPQYYELMSKVYENKQNHQGLMNIWKEAIAIFPMNNHFKISLAFQLLQTENIDEAEILGMEIVESDDKFTKAYILLGNIEEKRNRIKKALEYFEKALSQESNNVMIKISYARLLIKDNNHHLAMKICREILNDDSITANSKNADIVSKVGIMLTEMNRNDQALQVLLNASAMNEMSVETWNYLGVVYYRKKEYEKALESYQHAIELDPKFAVAYNNLGTLYLRMFLEKRNPEMIAESMDSFDRAIKIDPQLASAYNGRGSAFKFSNRVSDAVRDWKKALEIKPDFIDVYFNLGVTYLQAGNKDEALKILDLCKKRFYDRLPSKEQGRLDRLISEARK